MRNSLTKKVLLNLLLIIIFVNTSINVVFYLSKRMELIETNLQDAETIAQRIANTMREPIWNLDYNQIDIVLELEAKSRDVIAILYYDEKGTLKNGKFKESGQNIQTVSNQNFSIQEIAKRSICKEKKIVKNDMDLGKVMVYIGYRRLDESMRMLLRNYLLNTLLISAALVAFILFSIRTHILNPVLRLYQGMAGFSKMKFETRVRIERDDEIGKLAKIFNQMAETIYQYSQEMQTLVDEKTRELSEANISLKKVNGEMKKELLMARNIQNAIIPKILPDQSNISLGGVYQPMEDIGGDYYDVFNLGNHKIGVVISDVSGHGIPSAMITTMAKVSFSTNSTSSALNTGQITTIVDKELSETIGDLDYFVTAFYGIIDIVSKKFQYTNCGHTDIYIFRDGKINTRLGNNAFLLGKPHLSRFFYEESYPYNEVDLEVGDKIVLYTDGIPEMRNEKGDFLTEEYFERLLMEYSQLPAKEMASRVMEAAEIFRGNEPAHDDRTILIIEVISDHLVKRIDVDMGIAMEKSNQATIPLGTVGEKFRKISGEYVKALGNYKFGYYKNTIERLEKLKEKYSRSQDLFKVYNLEGDAYYMMKDYEKALWAWNEALKIVPDHEEVKANIEAVKKMMETGRI